MSADLPNGKMVEAGAKALYACTCGECLKKAKAIWRRGSPGGIETSAKVLCGNGWEEATIATKEYYRNKAKAVWLAMLNAACRGALMI
jgi:hypothetical protein